MARQHSESSVVSNVGVDWWVRRSVQAVGGLTEIGFVPNSSLLLIVSHQGRGLIDCDTGERVARDRDEDARGWFDQSRLAALDIGPAQGQWIQVFGLAGGTPLTWTESDWHACREGNDVVLRGPPGDQRVSGGSEELRACGFSPDGRFFLLAAPATLFVYSLRDIRDDAVSDGRVASDHCPASRGLG